MQTLKKFQNLLFFFKKKLQIENFDFHKELNPFDLLGYRSQLLGVFLWT